MRSTKDNVNKSVKKEGVYEMNYNVFISLCAIYLNENIKNIEVLRSIFDNIDNKLLELKDNDNININQTPFEMDFENYIKSIRKYLRSNCDDNLLTEVRNNYTKMEGNSYFAKAKNIIKLYNLNEKLDDIIKNFDIKNGIIFEQKKSNLNRHDVNNLIFRNLSDENSDNLNKSYASDDSKNSDGSNKKLKLEKNVKSPLALSLAKDLTSATASVVCAAVFPLLSPLIFFLLCKGLNRKMNPDDALHSVKYIDNNSDNDENRDKNASKSMTNVERLNSRRNKFFVSNSIS